MEDSVNLAGGWEDLWSAVSDTLGNGITNALTAIGVILVVASIIKWAAERRRAQGGVMGQQGTGMMWSLLLGAILAAPAIIFPILLTIFDALINAVVNLWNAGEAAMTVQYFV